MIDGGFFVFEIGRDVKEEFEPVRIDLDFMDDDFDNGEFELVIAFRDFDISFQSS